MDVVERGRSESSLGSSDVMLLIATGSFAGVVIAGVAALTYKWYSIPLAVAGGVLLTVILGGVLVAYARAAFGGDRLRLVLVVASVAALLIVIQVPNMTIAEPHFSFRDQAVHSLSAMWIGRTGSLQIQDPVLNSYIGFIPTHEPHTFVPQFLPGYPTYLSLFAASSGIEGLALANGLLLVLVLLLVARIAELLSGPRAALISIALILGAYSSWWFWKGTWSENIAGVFVLSTAASLLIAFHRRSLLAILPGAVSIAALVLTRPEASLYATSAALGACFLAAGARQGWRPSRQDLPRLAAVVAICLVVAAGFALRAQYAEEFQTSYISTSEAKSQIAVRTVKAAWEAAGSSFLSVFGEESVGPSDNILVHVGLFMHYAWDMFLRYGLVQLMVLALAGLLLSSKRFMVGGLMVILSPAAAFVLFPAIYPDQPWFLRRYAPVLIPALVIMAAVGLDKLCVRLPRARSPSRQAAAATLLAFVLVAPSLPATAAVASRGEYEQLPAQLSLLGEDLVRHGATSDDVLLLQGAASKLAPALFLAFGWRALQDRGPGTIEAIEGVLAEGPKTFWLITPAPVSPDYNTSYLPTSKWELAFIREIHISTLDRAAIVERRIFTNSSEFSDYSSWITDYENVPPRNWEDSFLVLHVYRASESGSPASPDLYRE